MANTSKEQIRTYLLDNFLFSENPSDLSDTASFRTTRIIDSMGMMELISFLESQFQIKVEDAEMVPENLDSVEQLAGYVGRKLEKKAAA